MPTFVAAFALQQLRDMEQLRRDFGHRPRTGRSASTAVPERRRLRVGRGWRASRRVSAQVVPR